MRFFNSLLISLFIVTTVYSQNDLQSALSKVKSISLPYTDSISYEPLQGINLDVDKWKTYGFDVLEVFNPDFDYAISGKLILDNSTLLLVSRAYSEEYIHWLCLVDDTFIVRSSIESAHDNSEGFLAIKSTINENEVRVVEWNEYNEKNEKLTIYRFENSEFKVH